MPPKFITRLIERLTSPREGEIILGDMHEEYQKRRTTNGKLSADVGYVFDFISLVIHRALCKKTSSSRPSFFSMLLTNYLKVVVRQFERHKLHNSINIIGLAVGLAVSLIIALFVSQELAYDRFHTKSDRLYLLPMTWKFNTTQISIAGTTSAAGPNMKEMFNKEIEAYARLQHLNMNFNHEQGPIVETGIVAADSTFFDLFTFPLLSGNPKRALAEPYSMVLTERAAAKYFGETWKEKSLMSQTVTEQSGRSYQVTGIMKDPPVESHIRFDVLISMTSLPAKEWEPNWDKSSMHTYILLAPGASGEDIVAELPQRVAKYSQELSNHVELDLIPITDVYLKNRKYSGMFNSDILYVYVFSSIAALVLILAIINYTNLSTARSLERAREVGVRKVVGALRLELFWQFISESTLVTLAAMIMALLLTWLWLPLFNGIAEKNIALDFISNPAWIAGLILMWLLISLLGGAYPAAVLSSFRPAGVLKGKLGTQGATPAGLRKSLVVFQFAVSIVLIVCTFTINNQLRFMVNKKVGIDKDMLLTVQLDSIARANFATLKNEFAAISSVVRSSSVSASPLNNGAKATVYGGDIGESQVLIYNYGVDPGFVQTSGLEIVAGADLSEHVPLDGTWEFLINESAVRFFGWTNQEAIGKTMNLWQTKGIVRGVVSDYHFLPLQKPIEPLLIHAGKVNDDGYINRFLIRIQGENTQATISALEDRWEKIAPGSPFTITFMEEHYHDLYRSERRLSTIMNIFSSLAILIAALGLFGLASYTTMQRTKELGIRKVLGATFVGLMTVVSGSFVRLVIVAFLVAVPASWLTMTKWLENFAYAVGFDWWLVVGSGVVTIAVTIGTVSYHALEAARVNPVESLRNE